MASVDDIEELIATRRLNGVDDGLYESDKNVANNKDYTLAYLKGYADAEEKYRARIKELEYKLLDTIDGTEIIKKETPEYIKENYIPIQKISNKIEELKKQKEELKYKAKLGLIQRINAEIKLLEELLEEK